MGEPRRGGKKGEQMLSPRKTEDMRVARTLIDAFRFTVQAVVQMQEAIHVTTSKKVSDNSVLGVTQRLNSQNEIIKLLDERIRSLEREDTCSESVSLSSNPNSTETTTDVITNSLCRSNSMPIFKVVPYPEIVDSEPNHSLSQPVSRANWDPSRSRITIQQEKIRSVPDSVPVPRMISGSRRNAVTLGNKLMKAAYDGRLMDVQMLIEAGADVNYSGSRMWTALHRAASKCRDGVLEFLIEKASDVNAQDFYGFTALHMAAFNDLSGRCVTRLIDAGAGVNGPDRLGRTPLHCAAEGGNGPAILALVAAGAAKNAKDDKGRLPFDVAKGECVRRLLFPS